MICILAMRCFFKDLLNEFRLLHERDVPRDSIPRLKEIDDVQSFATMFCFYYPPMKVIGDFVCYNHESYHLYKTYMRYYDW